VHSFEEGRIGAVKISPLLKKESFVPSRGSSVSTV